MNLELDLELLTDACLSTSNHSLGEPETHQYIPGRTLWGALATLAYRSQTFSESEAFRIFQQGAIRISDALPIQSNHRSYPVPFAWHEPKNTPGQKLQNFALESVRQQCTEQHQGKKGGWVSADRREVRVENDFSLRTSVDPSGKAREGLLFGLPVLRAGTRFHATLSGAQADLDKVLALVKNRELRVGRSKNSELGLLKVARRSQPVQRLEHGSGLASVVSIFCVSRCIFRDPRTGAPTLLPSPAAFGLPQDWTFDGASSFVRTTGVVHFNSKRGRPETERFTIERGSVLTFRGEKSVDLKDAASFVEHGVGEHCGQGYGEVLLAPVWLTSEEPFSISSPAKRSAAGTAEPTDPLFQWAKQRAGQKSRAMGLYSQAQQAADRLRRYRIPGSQWGVVRRMAREARFQPGLAASLWEDLFSKEKGFLNSGKRKLSSGWKQALGPLEDACQEKRSQADLPVFLEFLASACMRPASELKGDLS